MRGVWHRQWQAVQAQLKPTQTLPWTLSTRDSPAQINLCTQAETMFTQMFTKHIEVKESRSTSRCTSRSTRNSDRQVPISP